MELHPYLGGDLDPAALSQLFRIVILAGEAHKLDILHAAGHGEAAGHKLILAHPGGLADLGSEAHGFARVLLRILAGIQIPYAEVLVADLDHIRVDVEGQLVRQLVVSHAAIGVFVGDIAPAAGLAHRLVHELLILGGQAVGPVHHQQFALGKFIQEQLAHVVEVHAEGVRVGGADGLVDDPVLRHGFVQILHHPHAVVFEHHPARAGLFH